MKRLLISAAIFFAVSTTIFAQTEDAAGKSAVKLFRQDSSEVKKYKVSDGDKYIGKLSNDGYLLWTTESGETKITLEQCPAFPTIELVTEPNTMYEILLMDDKYATAIYEIEIDDVKERPWYFVYIFAGVVFVSVLLLTIIWLRMFSIFRVKNLTKTARILLENREYKQALENLNKALVKCKKSTEIWQLAERAYIGLNDFRNSEICRDKLSELLKGKPEKQLTNAVIRELKIDRYELIKALNDQGWDIDNINFVRTLNSGYSGARVILAEIIKAKNKAVNFGVIKIDPGKSENELLREAEGYKALSGEWNESLKKHIPQSSIFLKEMKLLKGKSTQNMLISSFADENSTKDVVTLREGLTENFSKYLPCVSAIKKFYEAQFRAADSTKFHTAKEHSEHILNNKLNKIINFEWENIGVQTDKKLVNIGGKLYPNIIYILKNNAGMWNKEGFSCKYSTIHGDLNLENIIIKSDMNFVLIDFEKTRETVFLYDIAFLTTWMMQIFVSEPAKDANPDVLTKFSEQIISFLRNSNTTIETPAFADNFRQILCCIYPFDKQPEQNEMKAFLLSLISASILRSFYELRDYKDSKSGLSKKNGIFFYAFACMLADNTDFVEPTKPSTKDAYDLY